MEGHLCDFPLWSYSRKRATVTSLHVDYDDGTLLTIRAPEGMPGPRFPGYLDVLLFRGYRHLVLEDHGELSMSRLGGLLPTKKREEYRIKNWTIPNAARFVLYSDRLRLPVKRVSRKSSNARRAIMPRFALSPVWTSSWSI
jgi:hypothetical protein